jgi:hypothetical protein
MPRRSLLPKPMPIMSTHSLKRKLYAFALPLPRTAADTHLSHVTVTPQQDSPRKPKSIRQTNLLLLRLHWM